MTQTETGTEIEVIVDDQRIGTFLVQGEFEGATLARFTPERGYAAVAVLFQGFEDAVTTVSMQVAEEFADKIDALLPTMRIPSAGLKERIYDLQINRNGKASFRTEENRLWW
jgi:hypothetical protein